MRQEGKIGIIILVILLILSLGGAGISFYYYRGEQLKVAALNNELKNLKAEKRAAENKLAESRKRVDGLTSQLQTTGTQIEGLNKQIEELDKELKQTRSEKDRFYSQIENLQSQLQKKEVVKKDWENEKIQAQKQIDKMQALLKKLRANKDELEAELSELKANKEVALGKIVVGQEVAVQRAPPKTVLTPTLEGKVLVVNKKYDFAVINLGSRDGLSQGEVLLVHHQGSYIGDIRLEKVQETMSACGFVTKEIKDRINEGDKIAFGKIVAGQEVAVQRAPPAAVFTPTLEGKVLVVNKKYDFAVINLGSRDGLNLGEVFSVHHRGSYIGNIRVDKIQETMSACVFESEKIENKIQEGDKVIRE